MKIFYQYYLFALVLLLGTIPLGAQTIPMAPERGGHAASLLSNGRVLLTGGVNENATLDSALLYNPADSTLTATGAMVTARTNHTSTLLPDGRVLITGGELDSIFLDTAELYNPATRVFNQTIEAMTLGRSKHTATLLPNGKVLVVGGSAADLFDPAAQTFTATAGTAINRKSHAAVLLNDGTVLIVGGYVMNIATRAVEIYDPVTETFTVLANQMNVPRANMTATLLPSGKVLVTGGFSGTSPHDETEIYDPANQTFTEGPPMLEHRSNHQAILQGDGRVVMIGGLTLESGFLSENEVYDPAANTFSAYPSLLVNRGAHTATQLPSGEIFVAGGATGNLTLQTAEVLDPITHAFTPLGNLQVARNQHRANLLGNGKVLLTAGSTNANNLFSAELFDPATDTFTLTGSLHVDRKSHTATTLQDGRVLITGGKGGGTGYLRSVEIYDPATELFTEIESMQELRALHTATLLESGRVLMVGGVQTGGVSTETAELFDPATETFTLTGSLDLGRKRHRAVLFGDGTVLVMGGNYLDNAQGGGDRETATAELYTPNPLNGDLGAFTQVGDMNVARSEHEATLLGDGNVLVTGGIRLALPGDLYNPNLQVFGEVGTMIQARGRHVAVRLSNPAWGSLVGQVLQIGGAAVGGEVFGGGQQAQDTVEIYDPATQVFTLFGSMTEARQNHTATELNDGRILIAGGVGRPFISGTAEILIGPSPSPSPSPSPTATPTPSPSPSATPSPSPSPSPSATPSPSPSPTPSPTPVESKPLNISTRGDARTGDEVLIGGFIITGGSSPKRILIRAIGPSLGELDPPVAGVLADPILELHQPDGTVITNDNWRDLQEEQIIDTTIPPKSDFESAIVASLSPADPSVSGSGAYTAVVRGKNSGTGVALVEVYDLDDPNATAFLANISTRGVVQNGDKAMIGGFIIGAGGSTGQVAVRAIGPSLAQVSDALPDPTLTLFNSDGAVVASNDDWMEGNPGGIEDLDLTPADPRESAILESLPAGSYTALVLGKGGTTGVGLIEVYYLP